MNIGYQPPAGRRYGQLHRVLVMAEYLRQLRFPITTEAINREVAERMGQRISPRTTLRDLQFLELAGFVRCERSWSHRKGHGLPPFAWKWAGDPILQARPQQAVLPPETLRALSLARQERQARESG